MLSFHKFPHPGNCGLGYPHQDSPNIVAKRGFCSLLPRVSEDTSQFFPLRIRLYMPITCLVVCYTAVDLRV